MVSLNVYDSTVLTQNLFYIIEIVVIGATQIFRLLKWQYIKQVFLKLFPQK